ncbi:hypothetical protein OROGR_001457 [Orobanche gracilis]
MDLGRSGRFGPDGSGGDGLAVLEFFCNSLSDLNIPNLHTKIGVRLLKKIKMLSLGKFPTQTHCNNSPLHKPIPQYLQFPSKPHFSFPTRHNFQAVVGKLQSGLHCNAWETRAKGNSSLTEMDYPDEFEDDGFLGIDDDEDDDGLSDEDEGEMVMPLLNMKKWLENRPRGFGEGKVYDTSIEDKLMEEIEQSRKAQLANVNRLKNSTVKLKPSLKNELDKEEKGPSQVQEGSRVRLLHLPKKKNIHKDLRLALEGARGILNVVPLVSGNEKTRDPVCKGIAFVDFKHHDDAQRFVLNFSGKSITFGKIEKQIKCEMMDSEKSNHSRDQSVDRNNFTPAQAIYRSHVKNDAHFRVDDPLGESVPGEVDGEEEINGALTTSHSDIAEVSEVRYGHARKLKTSEKKLASKRRKDKVPKLNIPGSANRLKIREKEMLAGVFSRYSATLKEQST